MILGINKRGQSIIESLIIILPVLLISISTIQWTMFKWSHSYISHQMYQGLICGAQGHLLKECEQNLSNHIKSFLKGASLQKIKLKKKGTQWKIEVLWNITYFNQNLWTFQHSRSLRVPEDLL